MKRQTFKLELITPCFSGGAEPDQRAEIRASSIRGQLRWWFRVLGGFKSLAPKSVREQENIIFGSAAGDEGTAGFLRLQINATGLISRKKDGQQLGHPNFSDPAFLTFPIQSREKRGQKTNDASRGVIESGTFTLTVISRDVTLPAQDIQALLVVFGNLGSLGFRARRAMGAVAFKEAAGMTLGDALSRFRQPSNLLVKRLPATSSKNAISVLGGWLKSCRAHGLSGKNEKEQRSSYFKFAENDHDIGYHMPGTQNRAAYRPALGLPIIQKTRRGTNNWEWSKNDGGRFASPLILRPHKDAYGKWHALVIFVESHKWPKKEKVFLNGREREVSLDLYEAMKNDSSLESFL